MKSPSDLIKTTLFLLIITGNATLLNGQVNFERADSIAQTVDNSYNEISELALALTKNLNTDIEKARVFFMWISNNIRYDCKKFHNRSKPHFKAKDEEDFKRQLIAWQNEQVLVTMKRRKGICGDYSSLFKALCDEIGLEAVIISGDSRDFHKPYRNNHDNPHAWNAVKIDDKWYLLDATWGAGYTDANVTKFYRKISPGFFLTPPEWFIQNHLPDEEKWQLLDEPISKKDFSQQLLINYGQDKFKINNFSPKVLKVKGNESKREIWIEFENSPKVLVIANKKKKRIQCDRLEKDGKTILRFSKSSSRSIIIYGGKSSRSRMDWLAKYEL